MRIRKFNESEDKLKRLEESFDEIRNILIDFEDSKVIEYFQPGYTYRFSKDANFLRQIVNIQDDSDKQYHSKDVWRLRCEIKTGGYNDSISSEDFNLLEEAMVAVN